MARSRPEHGVSNHEGTVAASWFETRSLSLTLLTMRIK
jgi:hypothetical protein